MARLVSKVYGEALYDFAKEENLLEKMCEEAYDISHVFSTSKELNEFISNPKVSIKGKAEFVKNLFINEIWSGTLAKNFRVFNININKGESPKILDFVSLIIEKGRAKDIKDIMNYFIHLALKDKNIGEAEVVSAIELDDKKKKEIKNRLVETTEYKDFIIDYKVDESLISGLRIKVNDKVFDNTYKMKLFDIKKHLLFTE